MKKVQIDQWSGSELTCKQGPNWIGQEKLRSALTRAETILSFRTDMPGQTV